MPITTRQQIFQVIDTLPEDSLSELVNFIGYLHYKSIGLSSGQTKTNFLLSIAGLGTSTENNISERDEEILIREVDRIHGWSLHTDEDEQV